MSKPLTLNILFESDWHVGEGAGAQGHIDAIVRRHPEDGLPYIPAKTLIGILRDGCERVVWGLDRGDENGPWHQFLRAIFGSSQEDSAPTAWPATLAIGPGRFDATLRSALATRPELREALVFLKPGVKLDDEGVAESQMLRFDEVVMAGAQLHAELSLDLQGKAHDSALALLSAGARTVERLGAKRRRGYGRCSLTIVGAPTGQKLLTELRRPPTLPNAPAVAPAGLTWSEQAVTSLDQWLVLALNLKLTTPVLVPAQRLGNVVTTRDYIPGSLLLPALNPWLQKLLRTLTTSALASGAVQVRNAYPCIGATRLLPVPTALFKLKDGDLFSNHLGGDPSDGKQRKQQRVGYASVDGLPLLKKSEAQEPEPGLVTVETLAVTHATIEDARQRPTSDVGGVFTYEAIRPTQRYFETFRAQLWIEKSLLDKVSDKKGLHHWRQQYPKQIRIGRSKKDDYGLIELTCQVDEMSAFEADNALTLWLVAPLILRDEGLEPVADVIRLAREIEDALEALDSTCAGITLKPAGAFARPWRDDGWNNAWQTQRATRFGLAPGSCFRFTSDRTIPDDVLVRLQASGLGERRGEGYGEICLNPKLLKDAEVPSGIKTISEQSKKVSEKNNKTVRIKSATIQPTDFTRALQRRAARAAIRRHVFLVDADHRNNIGWRKNQPSNTQLGALRAVLESMQSQANIGRVCSWIDALEDNEKRRENWPSESLKQLRQHLTDAHSIWQTLGLTDQLPVLPQHQRAALLAELRCEAVRTLWLAAISRQLSQNNSKSHVGETAEEVNDGA